MLGTRIAQPADVGLQRLLKHHIKRSATDFVIAHGTRQLTKGIAPINIKLPTDLPTLRNASIPWLIDAYTYFVSHPDVVRKAWENCQFDSLNHGTLDLSYTSLLSASSLEHSRDLFAIDSALKEEWAKFVSSKDSFSTISGDCEAEKVIVDGTDDFSDDVSIATDVLGTHIASHGVGAPELSGSDSQDRTTAAKDFMPVMPADFHPSTHAQLQEPESLSLPHPPPAPIPSLPGSTPSNSTQPAQSEPLDSVY